jgi:Kef-type K+ transport system membrane component KefB
VRLVLTPPTSLALSARDCAVLQAEGLLFNILLQLVVMVAAARAGNQLSCRLGQPGVIGEIFAGLLLGPSLFGHFFPGTSVALFGASSAAPITVISQIGVVLLMFQIGADFDFSLLKHPRNRNGAVVMAAVTTVVPWLLGFGIGQISAPVLAPHADRFIYSLFCGISLAIMAVPVLGRILREFDLAHTEIGVVAIAVAALNDVTGWVLLAGISAYATATFSPRAVGMQLTGIVLLGAITWFVLRPLVSWLLEKMPIKRGEVGANALAAIVCLIFLMAMCTYALGIFTMFGAFLSGLLFHANRPFVDAWRAQVGRFVLVFFLPVFFTYTGLRTNVLGLVGASDWAWVTGIVLAAMLGKIVPGYIASRSCGFGHRECTIFGALMNTRGLTELIVLNIGYDLGFIPRKVFTMLVIMAVVTTVMTGPLLRVLLPRAGYFRAQRVEA